MDINAAVENQLKNIETRTGKSLNDLVSIIKASGLTKHGQIVAMLKADLGMGHGDANTLTHYANQSDGASQAVGKSDDAVLDEIYSGPKEALRPIHEQFMANLSGWGEFEIAPKKGYVSLRRKKQFAMIGPATNSRVELGLNMKDIPATDRLMAEKPGSMCQYKVKLIEPGEVDAELMAWVKTAFDAAG